MGGALADDKPSRLMLKKKQREKSEKKQNKSSMKQLVKEETRGDR